MELNAEQLQAIEHVVGPTLIVAGAGTGKTKVITEKIKHLVVKHQADPASILALTFTDKAAGEMEERVDQIMPYGYFQMNISTFHAFAKEILKRELSHIGLNANYRLLDKVEAIMFFKKHLYSFELNYFRPSTNPYRFISDLMTHFGRLQDELVYPEDYVKWATSQIDLIPEEQQKYLELASCYEQYQKLKEQEGVFENSDLIFYLYRLWKERPSILAKYQAQYKYGLIDEFQDTNIAQYELIKLLYPPAQNSNLTVVGDDSQSIYKFRGASISNILNFMRDYPQAKQVTLNQNYRSGQEILDKSHNLISHNNPYTLEAKLGISKRLIARHKSPHKEAVKFILTDEARQEAQFIAQEIKQLVDKFKYKFSDIAILVRAMRHAEVIVGVLLEHGIPYRYVGTGALFRQPEVKDLIAYLTLLDDLGDSVACYRVLNLSALALDKKDINLLVSCARRLGLSLYQTVNIYCDFAKGKCTPEYQAYQVNLPPLLAISIDGLIKVDQLIQEHLVKLNSEPAFRLLYEFLDRLGVLKELNHKPVAVVENITKFMEIVKNFSETYEGGLTKNLVEYLKLALEYDESPSSANELLEFDGVRIMTVHGAKGLEFPIVFLPSLINTRFPGPNRGESLPIPEAMIKETLPAGDYHIQEERRLFYVALTRAQDVVYLTAAKRYSESKRLHKLSPFIAETIGLEALNKVQELKTNQEHQLSMFTFKPTEVSVITCHSKLNLNTVSYSQLSEFRECPKSYYYNYVIKLPTETDHSLSFGNSVHRALQYFGWELKEDPHLGVERLIELYYHHWIPFGYASQRQQQAARKSGEAILRRFWEKFPIYPERVLGFERNFRIPLEGGVYLTGKIDRIDKYNGRWEIIDYKTGKMPDLKNLQKDWQLAIYALAVHDKSLYNVPYDQIDLTFYYLDVGEKVSLTKTQDEVEVVRAEIIDTVENMRLSNFQANPGNHCKYCPFAKACDEALWNKLN